MNAAKIVIGEEEGERGLEILPLFRESVGQPGQPSHLHSDREVLPLYVARADALGIRVTVDRDWDRI